ncbi:hypothetical protein BCL76_115180 [Streptomyces sp. CG 926]|uniref:hypothetical protein n=1 Tax=Streptomyces sp. CG 926 TaxID=1882405 RepID=UPI000D6C2712|nr:hypothetical protein [Streptomyces sp. CG 926]PWK64536.1 hypothetical protein BCL76_115180 [Streptomyces sp. CG 926]
MLNILLLVLLGVLAVVAVHDLVQRRHSLLRNYPLLGRLRFALEALRPEIQQYFIERNFDGRPFDRDTRSIVYERAKGTDDDEPFGTERDLDLAGSEYLTPSMAPRPVRVDPPRVRIGGPGCTKPYDMALLNVSAMSFGSLSANAVRALNTGARLGGFAQDRRRARAVDVGDKSRRVERYQKATVLSALRIMAAMGVDGPSELRPHQLLQRVDPYTVRSYAELHEWLTPGQLLASVPDTWASDWRAADPDRFTH